MYENYGNSSVLNIRYELLQSALSDPKLKSNDHDTKKSILYMDFLGLFTKLNPFYLRSAIFNILQFSLFPIASYVKTSKGHNFINF